MESRLNQHKPTPDQLGVSDPVQHQAQNEVVFVSPQSSMLTQVDRQAERVDKKTAKRKEKEQEARDKRAKAEEFRLTHERTSLVKANQRYDQPDNSRWTTLGRRAVKIKKIRTF